MSIALASVVTLSYVGGIGPARVAVAEAASGAAIVPLTPARLLDTRGGTGGHTGPIVGGASIDVVVTGVGGVPDQGVAGVVLNVTVTEPTAPSFLTVWPTGSAMPTASSLNMVPGQTIPNLVIAKVGDGGQVSIFNKFGATHVIADVAGWIPAESDLVTLNPARILDTRAALGVKGTQPVGPDGVISLDVTGHGGVPDSGVGAVLVNITVTEPTAGSYVTVWPTGDTMPTASSLNMSPGQTLPNLVIAKVGDNGSISLFNRFGSTHLIADVVAYTSASSTLVPLNPARVLDTREPIGVDTAGPVPENTSISLEILDRGGVPATGVVAVALNVTVTQPSAASFVTSWPAGLPMSETSSLNMSPGETIPNLVIVPLGAGGKIDLFNRFGTTHLIADVVAYIRPPSGETATQIAPETRVVEPDQIEKVIGDPDVDQIVTVHFAPGTDVDVGTIVLAEPSQAAPVGLLRRVTSVTTAPDGTIITTTTAAMISDAIPQGSIDFTTTAEGATVRFVETAGNTPFDTTLECQTTNTLETAVDGEIDPTVKFNMVWAGGLQHAQVTAGLDVALNFTAQALASVTCSASRPVAEITFAPIVILVAGFPLVFVPEIAVAIELAGKIEGTITGGASYAVDMTAGIIYDATTGINTIGAVTPSVTSTLAATATAEATLTLTPSLTISAYGIGGPKAALPLAVSADIDACRTPYWEIHSSIKPTFSLALAGWLGGASIADTTYVLNDNLLAQGGTPPATGTDCEKSVNVVSHNVGSTAATRADYQYQLYDVHTHEIITESEIEDDDLYQNQIQGGNGTANNGGAVGRLSRRVTPNPEWVDIGPYVAADTSRSAAASSGAPGASSAATASAGFSFTDTGNEWTITLDATGSGNAGTQPDTQVIIGDNIEERDYGAGWLAFGGVGVSIEVVGDHQVTMPCTPGMYFWRNNSESLLDEQGCLTVSTFTTGEYYFGIGALTRGSLNDGEDGSGFDSTSVTIMLTE